MRSLILAQNGFVLAPANARRLNGWKKPSNGPGHSGWQSRVTPRLTKSPRRSNWWPKIRFDNGREIEAIPANPKTARGYSTNVILDEFAYHDDPDAIWAAMAPSITNPMARTFDHKVDALYAGKTPELKRQLKLRVVSTFNGRDNKFYQLWENAKRTATAATT